MVVLLTEAAKMPCGVPLPLGVHIRHLLSPHLLKPGGSVRGGRVVKEEGLVLMRKLPRLEGLLIATIGLWGRTLDIRSDFERIDLCLLWKWVALGIWGWKVVTRGTRSDVGGFSEGVRRVLRSFLATSARIGLTKEGSYPLASRCFENSSARSAYVPSVEQSRLRRVAPL